VKALRPIVGHIGI